MRREDRELANVPLTGLVLDLVCLSPGEQEADVEAFRLSSVVLSLLCGRVSHEDRASSGGEKLEKGRTLTVQLSLQRPDALPDRSSRQPDGGMCPQTRERSAFFSSEDSVSLLLVEGPEVVSGRCGGPERGHKHPGNPLQRPPEPARRCGENHFVHVTVCALRSRQASVDACSLLLVPPRAARTALSDVDKQHPVSVFTQILQEGLRMNVQICDIMSFSVVT